MHLNTQISEYDCAPTTLMNALSIMYKRDEIPVTIIKIIYKYTLDCKNKIIGDCGTSRKAMKKISNKINKYSKKHNFDLNFKYLTKNNCNINNIKICLQSKGVVIVRSLLDLEHYYLITNMDDKYFYIWDPYNENMIKDNYNLLLEISNVNNVKNINYSLGPINKREIILINKR